MKALPAPSVMAALLVSLCARKVILACSGCIMPSQFHVCIQIQLTQLTELFEGVFCIFFGFAGNFIEVKILLHFRGSYS